MHFMIGTPWEGTFFNATGQIPSLSLLPSPIDPVTSPELYTRTGFDGQEYQLIFSDEFETPGRSFYPGDDPFWEAVDLWVSHDLHSPSLWKDKIFHLRSTGPLKISSGTILVK